MRRWLVGTAPRAWLAVCLCCCLLGLGCDAGRSGGSGNLLAGLSPSASHGVRAASLLTDGVAAHDGEHWETDVAAQLVGADSFVTYDLGEVVPLGAVLVQGDHNDVYRVLVSEDGEVFEQLWDSKTTREQGLRTRYVDGLDASARFVRLEAARGDGRYAVSELQVFSEPPMVSPPDMPRRRGLSLELVARTQILLFGAAAIAFLLLTFRGAPIAWTLACAALPLWAGIEAVEAVLHAWPVEQRQVSMVRGVAAAVAAAAVLREALAPPRFPANRGAVLSSLAAMGVVAVLAFYNLGRPQFWDASEREPTAVHLLDLRQYYATAKYFDELGYRGMYLADVAAYAEDAPGGVTLDKLRDTPMRDLTTHRMSTVGEQRQAIEAIKGRFSPERWEQYKRDARYFREVMGNRDYLRYMFDFGGNATPVWISLAHFLFSSFEANTTAFLLTGLLDPLLFLITFLVIGRVYGPRTAFVVMVVFGANDFIMYGSNWGGATLRHDWLMYIALGVCALKRKRWIAGGILLALSTSIRAFPAITLVAATFPALWWLGEWVVRERSLPSRAKLLEAQRPIIVTVVSAAITFALLVAVTSARWSLPSWADWLSKVARLSADPHGNSVALRGLVAGWQSGHHQVLLSRWPIYAALVAFYVVGVFLICRKRPIEQAAVWGLVLVPVVFYAANYYIHVVCLLPLLVVESPRAARAGRPSVSHGDAWIWVILLGLCTAQYWTVLVSDLPLHFHLSTVLLFAALTLLVTLSLRRELREGNLEFVERLLSRRDPVRDASG